MASVISVRSRSDSTLSTEEASPRVPRCNPSSAFPKEHLWYRKRNVTTAKAEHGHRTHTHTQVFVCLCSCVVRCVPRMYIYIYIYIYNMRLQQHRR